MLKPQDQKASGCFNSTSITHQVAKDLGSRIVAGEFHASNSLPSQKELCKQYGVSLITIREAIKMLNAKRMIYSRMSQGHKVEPEEYWNLLDPDILGWLAKREFEAGLLREFNEVRYAIEPIAAMSACELRFEDIRRLEEISKTISRLNRDGKNSLNMEIEFHLLILQSNKNRLFQQLSPLISSAHQYHYNQFSDTIEHSRIKANLYRTVSLAVKEGNSMNASQSMKRLLTFIASF